MEDEDEGGGSEGAPAWMATFADLMSLLLTFFVLLLSFANMDVMKFQGMIGSMRDAFGVKHQNPGMHIGLTDSITQLYPKEAVADDGTPNENEKMAAKLRKLIERRSLNGQVEVTSGKDGVTVRVEGDMMFGAGETEISPQSFVFLDEMAEVFKQMNYDVTVEGHTDNTPTGNDELDTNWHLSSMRAANAAAYLSQVGGIDSSRLAAKGLGSSKPLVKNDSPKGRARNRRVEFVYHKVTPSQPRMAR